MIGFEDCESFIRRLKKKEAVRHSVGSQRSLGTEEWADAAGLDRVKSEMIPLLRAPVIRESFDHHGAFPPKREVGNLFHLSYVSPSPLTALRIYALKLSCCVRRRGLHFLPHVTRGNSLSAPQIVNPRRDNPQAMKLRANVLRAANEDLALPLRRNHL